MSAQTKYGYSTPIGAAGGIVDVAPHQIDTFLNEEENGVLKFGVGVVQGSKPGVNIALPEKACYRRQVRGYHHQQPHHRVRSGGQARRS